MRTGCHFRAIPSFTIAAPTDARFACDVIVVGPGREERAELVRPLMGEFRVKVFGGSWAGYGIEATELDLAPKGLIGAAYSSATIGLDFARNLAGLAIAKLRLFGNCRMRLYSLPRSTPLSCRILFDDSEILTFRSPAELVEKRSAGDSRPRPRRRHATATYYGAPTRSTQSNTVGVTFLSQLRHSGVHSELARCVRGDSRRRRRYALWGRHSSAAQMLSAGFR